MAKIVSAESGRIIMGKLGHGADLLEQLTDICRKEKIRCGRIEALGAVSRARVAFYDQQDREYRFLVFEQPLEIAMLVGNVSLKDGSPMVHAHITLADETGRVYGGHLASGTIIFACEFNIQALDGPILERGFDEETGLPLWTIQD